MIFVFDVFFFFSNVLLCIAFWREHDAFYILSPTRQTGYWGCSCLLEKRWSGICHWNTKRDTLRLWRLLGSAATPRLSLLNGLANCEVQPRLRPLSLGLPLTRFWIMPPGVAVERMKATCDRLMLKQVEQLLRYTWRTELSRPSWLIW